MPRVERPLGSEDTPLLRFAGDLRRLRHRAGLPSYRELGRRANYSAAALSEAVSGRRLPSLAVTVAFVRACEGDVEAWTARWRDLAATVPGAVPAARSPYPGLAAYQVEDADHFFGREAVVDSLLRLIEERPFVGVFGASGAGKSSLLRAGLAARANRTTLVLQPGPDPITEMATAVADRVDEPVARVRDDLAADPETLRTWLSKIPGDVLLVVDQFEEVFTLCGQDHQRWVVRALTSAAGRRARVVVGVRADFYGHCARHPELVTALNRAQVLLGPMSTDELRRAITEPAGRLGVTLETALVARLVTDVAGQPAALPLLSHVLVETWRRRRGLALTLAGYEDAGGVEHALARTAEQTFEQFSDTDQDAVRLLFLRLVAPGDGTEDTKRRARRHELDVPDALLDRLTAARLISMDHDGVELVHEALLRAWPRLAAWITEDRDAMRAHRRLADATDAWEAHRRDPDLLYRGAQLEQAERLRHRLNSRESAFVIAGQAAARTRAEDRRRGTRRLRQLVAVLAALVVLLAGAAVVAVTAQRAAARERNEALSLRAAAIAGDQLRALSRNATNELVRSRARAAAELALAAYRVAPTTEARTTLMLAHAAAGATTLGDGHLVPPGKIAITSRTGKSGAAQLWRPAGAHWRSAGVIPGDDDSFVYLVSADERTLVTSYVGDATSRVWDVTDPERPREVALPPGLSHFWSADSSGQLLAAIDDKSRTAVVFRLADRSVRRLPPKDVERVALLADGTGIVLTRRDGDRYAAELWSLDGARVATLLRDPKVMDVTAGSAGLIGVSASSGDISVVHASDPHAPRTVIRTSGASSTEIAFGPEGRTIAVLGVDRVGLWDVASGAPLLSLRIEGLALRSPRVRAGSGDLVVLWEPNMAGPNADAARTSLWRLEPDFGRVVSETCAAPVAVDWDRYFPGLPRTPLCP